MIPCGDLDADSLLTSPIDTTAEVVAATEPIQEHHTPLLYLQQHTGSSLANHTAFIWL